MMKKFILLILSIVLISFLGVVVWMNLTPGYFQYGPCGCGVGYYTDEEINGIQVKCMTMCYVSRPGRFLDGSLLLMSRLDLNRGRSAGPSIRDYVCPTTTWVDCMPGSGPVKAQCQKEYLDWAKKNCPNFQGAAY